MNEKQTIWLSVQLRQGMEMEVNGLFWTKDEALAICDEYSAAIEFEIGRDYREITDYLMFTLKHPEGVQA